MTDFPPDDVLIARGKYSTLASERREILKGLQKDAQQIANTAHKLLRGLDDVTCAQAEANYIEEVIGDAQTKLELLATLAPVMGELQPLAWGKHKEEF